MSTCCADPGMPTSQATPPRPVCSQRRHLAHARLLSSPLPDSFQARRIVEVARQLEPGIDSWCARTRRGIQGARILGVGRAVMGERELAHGMLEYSCEALGAGGARARAAGRGTAVDPEGT